MKKIITMLATCVLTLLCVFGITACSKPELDFVEARENLMAKDYEVSVETLNEDGIEEMLYAKKGDEYIYIARFKESSVAKKYYNKELAQYEAGIDVLEAEIEYYEELLDCHRDELSSAEINYYEDEIKDCNEEIAEIEKTIENSGRSGKYVWRGTEYAIADTK